MNVVNHKLTMECVWVMRGLEGKVALLTGAASGIGQGTSYRLAEEGVRVVACDISDDTTTVDKLRADGAEVHHVVMDVRRREDWQRAVAEALEAFGTIDLLGNIAGVSPTIAEDTVVGCTDEQWDLILDTHLRGIWLGMQATIPTMKANGGGRIVNFSSAAAIRGMDTLACYSASKAAILGLTRQAALTYAPDNILINAICPGTTDTPILGDFGPTERQAFAQSHLLKRLGTPADMAGTVAHLFSDDASFITGMTHSVDGGWTVNGRCL
jgi:NAD(P)-dependent dehydrogenase (short-subunit alcohol dehydrogenase family)